MSVLVDTSVWIRFLAGKAPYASRLASLLSREDVVGHRLIHGELLMGDNGGRTRLLRDYELLVDAPVLPHDEVAAFVRRRSLTGRGLGWIDAHLLGSALVGRHELWSADAALVDAARGLRIAHV